METIPFTTTSNKSKTLGIALGMRAKDLDDKIIKMLKKETEEDIRSWK